MLVRNVLVDDTHANRVLEDVIGSVTVRRRWQGVLVQ